MTANTTVERSGGDPKTSSTRVRHARPIDRPAALNELLLSRLRGDIVSGEFGRALVAQGDQARLREALRLHIENTNRYQARLVDQPGNPRPGDATSGSAAAGLPGDDIAAP